MIGVSFVVLLMTPSAIQRADFMVQSFIGL